MTTADAHSQVPRSPQVPRWAWRAALVVPLLTLPSALWRLALIAGVPLMAEYELLWWEPLYMVGLSAVATGFALLTLGLVQPWGEVVPRWIPLLAGRRIPPLVAVVPATLGALAVTAFMLFILYGAVVAGNLQNFGGPLQQAVVAACYFPLLGWSPLLVAVTVAYWRRRTSGTGAKPPSRGSQPGR